MPVARVFLTRFLSLLTIAVLSVMLLAVLGQSASGQEPVRIKIDQVIVDDEGLSLTAILSVSDKDRLPIPGLTAFEIRIDGQPVTPVSISSAVDEETGVAVLLLIDVSGSMAGEPITEARRAASLFVQELRANDSAAVVPFGSEAPRLAGFRSDSTELQSGVSSLIVEEKNQGTALYDSIAGVLNATWETPLQRRALILLTDGRESGRSFFAGREEALAAAGAAGVPVFTIGLGAAADIELLQELANAGGGSFYFAPNPEDIPTIFEAIGTTLRSQYVLSMPLPDSSRDERSMVIQLELSDVVLSAGATFVMPMSVQPNSDGGTMAWLGPAAGIGTVLLAGAGFFLWLRQRRQRKAAYLEGRGGEPGIPRRGAGRGPEPEPVAGSLTVLDGPNSGVKIVLGQATVEIGTAADCELRLDGHDGTVAPTHARVWLKGDRLMVHHVARKRQTFVGDRAVEWATLEARDTLRIGPHIIAFGVATGA